MTEQQNTTIIGIAGLIGSGKDTVANYLATTHQYKRISFAETLKDAVSAIFDWDRELLEGSTKHSREWREQVDPWWSDRLGIEVTPRWVLQFWGTNVLRQHFHDDIWIASLENKIRKAQDNIVISDVRFPNEVAAIHASGGIVIQMIRGPLPQWWQWAVDYNRGPKKNLKWATSKQNLEKCGVHTSEYSIAGTQFDCVIENNSSIDELYKKIDSLVNQE